MATTTILPFARVEQPLGAAQEYRLPRKEWGIPLEPCEAAVIGARPMGSHVAAAVEVTEDHADAVYVSVAGQQAGAYYAVGVSGGGQFGVTISARPPVDAPPAPVVAGVPVAPDALVAQRRGETVVYELALDAWNAGLAEPLDVAYAVETLRGAGFAETLAVAPAAPTGRAALVAVSGGAPRGRYDVVRTVTTRTVPAQSRRRAFTVETA